MKHIDKQKSLFLGSTVLELLETILLGFMSAAYLTELIPPLVHDLSLALDYPTECWVALLLQPVLLTMAPRGVGETSIFTLRPEHRSPCPKSLCFFNLTIGKKTSARIPFHFSQAGTSREYIPWDIPVLSECPLT